MIVFIVLAAIIGCVILYWIVSPLFRDRGHPSAPPDDWIDKSAQRKCPSCGSINVEGKYGDEHQRYQCSNCGRIFQ